MGNKIAHSWTIETWDARDRGETLLWTVNVKLARAAFEIAIEGETVRKGQTIALCHGAQILRRVEPK